MAKGRCDVLPTLEAYKTRAYGNPSLSWTVWPAPSKDGPTCEKLRFDRNAYLCQIDVWGKSAEAHRRALKDNQHSLTTYSKVNPGQVGGPAAKSKTLRGLANNIRRIGFKYKEASTKLLFAESMNAEIEERLDELDCKK